MLHSMTAAIATSTVERDSETLLVAFADTPDGDGETVMIMRALSFDEQDRELGQDTYCVCIDSATHYGGVESWSLSDGVLELAFDQRASTILGARWIEILLPANTPSTLAEDLLRIFGFSSITA